MSVEIEPSCFGSFTMFSPEKTPCLACNFQKGCADSAFLNKLEVEAELNQVIDTSRLNSYLDLPTSGAAKTFIERDFKAAMLEKASDLKGAYRLSINPKFQMRDYMELAIIRYYLTRDAIISEQDLKDKIAGSMAESFPHLIRSEQLQEMITSSILEVLVSAGIITFNNGLYSEVPQP